VRRYRARAGTAAVALTLLAATGCSGAADPASTAGPASTIDSAATTDSASTTASGSTTDSAGVRSPAPVADWGYPSVLPRQAQQVVGDGQAALVKAYAGGAVAAAGARLSGPAAEMLAARLRVAAVRHTALTPDALTVTRLMVPRAGPWPRWFVAAGSDPVSATPVLRVYLSPSVRAPYALWAQLSLLPGVTLPEPAGAAAGAPVVAPDDAGLLVAPTAVAAAYATVLATWRSSIAFAVDPLRSQVAARTAKDIAALAGVATVTSAHTVVPGSVRAMRLTDGSVLVLAALRQTYRATVTRGAVQVDADLAALAGRSSFGTRLERTADEVVAFVVPAAGSTLPPRLVAAAKADVAAAGS